MKAKKVLAMLMASAMIMGTTVTAFAADVPKETDYMDVTESITGIEESATITAYQIIDAKYTDDGFAGYEWVAGTKKGEDVVINNNVVEGLTDQYITAVAANTADLTSTTNLNQLPVGTWMLIVTGTDLDKVYNPMIISVYYTKSGSDNTMANGSVDAEDNWELATSGAYAKSSDIPVTKTVDDGDKLGDNDKAAVGETVSFTIDTEIPSYSNNSAAKFIVSDTITNGLEYVIPEGKNTIEPKVTVGGVTVDPIDSVTQQVNYTVEMTNESGKIGFKITFDPTYIKKLANADTNRELEITYEATVTDKAITVVGQNDVTVEYDHGSTTATEYVYSVSFDGIAKKIGEGTDANGLAGATFTLYDTWTDAGDMNNQEEADELSGVVGTSTTSEGNYRLSFKGLDADRTYYLTETEAPEEYSLNNTVYAITFTNVSVAENGTVTYDVNVDGNKVTTVTYGQTPNDSSMNIENTKLSDLPSTGGIGTTIFTIGGCAIMVTAAGLYFATRKKEQN